MTDRIVVAGIDTYEGAPLQGCVADAEEDAKKHAFGWAEGLFEELRFKWKDISLVTNHRAHSQGLKDRLGWLVQDLKAGDRAAFFFSGHGAFYPVRDKKYYEVDGLVEMLCPCDFKPDDDDTWLVDVDFVDYFDGIPAGVNFVIFLDSCFSGGMSNRGLSNQASRHYPLESTPDFYVRLEAAREKAVKTAGLLRAGSFANVAVVECCQEDQTSSEANLDGRRGVGTYFFWRTLEGMADKPLAEVVDATAAVIKRAGFAQVPRLTGPDAILSAPYMHRLA